MIQLPQRRIGGRALRAIVATMKHTPARGALTRLLRHDLGIDALRALSQSVRGRLPSDVRPVRARASHARSSAGLGALVPGAWPHPVAAYAAAYREGRTTPEVVVDRCLAAAKTLAARTPSVGPLLALDERARADAKLSGERMKTSPRGPLEGVPIVIKEEVDVAGLPTRSGTGWMQPEVARADAVAVARLRAAGAIVLGHTPMTEYGMSPLGGNVHRVMPRNPHDTGRLPGGSSSGTGVAVATGLVPVGLGSDGGGSIRIPACFNGVFGLKPTFGRIPAVGDAFDGDSSVVHLGPLGASAHDLALFVQVAAGADARDPASVWQPALAENELTDALARGVAGLRIGIDEDEWAAAERDVQDRGREALRALERDGAVLVNLKLDLASRAAAIGYLSIGLETYASLKEVRETKLDRLGHDLQLLLLGLSTFDSDDYIDGQRLRSALRLEIAEALRAVDVLALPTTASAAPRIDDREATEGFADPAALSAACRYAFIGNLTGIPCGTAPVGIDRDGMPVGLQILGDAWDEAAVLQVLAHLERTGAAAVRRPRVNVEVLGE